MLGCFRHPALLRISSPYACKLVAAVPPSMTAPLRATRGVTFDSLESLRGLAACLVAVYHAPWRNHLDGSFVDSAYLMVDLFFVLSGFVMAHAYANRLENFDDARRFVILRLGRVYPLHLALLLAWLGFECAKYLGEVHLGTTPRFPAFSVNDEWAFVANLFLLHSLNVTDGMTFNVPSWSISAEFWSYMAFVVVFLVASGRRARLLTAACITVASVLLLVVLNGPEDFDTTYKFGAIRCLAGFFLGCVAYEAYRWIERRRLPGYLATGAAAGFVLFLWAKDKGASDLLIGPVSAVLIVMIAKCPDAPGLGFLKWPAFRWLGAVSYSIYMVHFAVLHFFRPVVNAVMRRLIGPDLASSELTIWLGDAALTTFMAATLLVSALTWRWIENPWRDRSRQWAQSLRSSAVKTEAA